MPPADVPVTIRIDSQTPPLMQVQKMDAGEFFGRLARLMKPVERISEAHPPTSVIARVQKDGGLRFANPPYEAASLRAASPGTACYLQRRTCQILLEQIE